MQLSIHKSSPLFKSYRAARVRSLFNVETGNRFDLDLTLPLEDEPWSIGVVVGPSGSGKTSIGEALFKSPYRPSDTAWPQDQPIVAVIGPDKPFDEVTGALAAVGLGDVPAWLRPYAVLSNGEQFRASLARILADAPAEAVIDEFTSVVDRQIAKFGALAFAKAWRRTAGKCVLLTPHYDILDWVQPDWVYDTASQHFSRDRLQRPSFELDIFETDWRFWPLFEKAHYLKMPRMVAAKCYIGVVDNKPVVHVAVAPRIDVKQFRAARLVVATEYQGAGIGMRFVNAVCQMYLEGKNPYGLAYPTCIHTSHPGLAAGMRRDPHWQQISANLYSRPKRGPARLAKAGGKMMSDKVAAGLGFGSGFRAVQGFKYVGVSASIVDRR